MGVTAVFIDGGYLEQLLKHDHGSPRIDMARLGRLMAEGNELLRTYYYHCLPYQSSSPTPEERSLYAGKRAFLSALQKLPRFQVRLGRLAFRGIGKDGERIFVQKRVDTMVGVDMALLAGKGRVTHVALLSGDSDLVPALEAVKREGVVTLLWHGSFSSERASPSRELWEICDERREITRGIIESVKRDPPERQRL